MDSSPCPDDHELLEVVFAQTELVEVLPQLSGKKGIARATIGRDLPGRGALCW